MSADDPFGAHTASWHRACVPRSRRAASRVARPPSARGARPSAAPRRPLARRALTPPTPLPARSVIRVTLASPEDAAHAAAALSVDAELQAGRAGKSVTSRGAELTADVRAADLRLLRIAGAAYFDMLGVVLRTLREFA